MEISEYKEILSIVLGFAGIVVTQYVAFRKQKSNQDINSRELKALVTEKDKRQDAKIDKLVSYADRNDAIKYLRIKIRKEVAKIVNTHHLDNTELVTMLNNSRDLFIELINTIAETPFDYLDIHDIESDVKLAAKNLQGRTRWERIDTPQPTDDLGVLIAQKTYRSRLKYEVVLPNMRIFTQRLKEEVIEDAKKFNGTFSKIALGTILTITDESIRIYRDCKKAGN